MRVNDDMSAPNEPKRSFFQNDSAAIGSSMLVYLFSMNGLTLLFYAAVSFMLGFGFGVLEIPGFSLLYRFAELAGYTVSFLLTIFIMSRSAASVSSFAVPKRPWRAMTVPFFFGAFFLINYLNYFVEILFNAIGIHGIDVSLDVPRGGAELWVFVFQYTLVPAILEEILFRGVILGRLRKYGDGFAIIFSSFVFALMHNNLVTFPGIALLGVLFAFAAVRSGSLIPGVIMHFLNNALAVAASYLEQHGGAGPSETFFSAVFIAEAVSLAAAAAYLIFSSVKNARVRRAEQSERSAGFPAAPVHAARGLGLPRGRGGIALGEALSSGWMIAFIIVSVYTVVSLEFMPRILEQWTASFSGFFAGLPS